jgi:hypothetical protein
MANPTITQNPTFGKIKEVSLATSTTASEVTVLEIDGSHAKMRPKDLPIIQPTTNYFPTFPTLAGHLLGLDNKLGQIGQTTAGSNNRIYVTGESVTVNSTSFFLTSSGKGSVATASPATVTNNDNQKKYFTKDIISPLQAIVTTSPAGIYSGQLSVSKNVNGDKDRFTIEIYKTNANGVPIDSGIINAPVGGLGVPVIAILDSGEMTLPANATTNITVSGVLSSVLTLNTGERVRYHVSAAKVGVNGGDVIYSVFYGSNHSSFIDVPVQASTDGVFNKSTVLGITTTDALNSLKLSLANNTPLSGVYYPEIIPIQNCTISTRRFPCQYTKIGNIVTVTMCLQGIIVNTTDNVIIDIKAPFALKQIGTYSGTGVLWTSKMILAFTYSNDDVRFIRTQILSNGTNGDFSLNCNMTYETT